PGPEAGERRADAHARQGIAARDALAEDEDVGDDVVQVGCPPGTEPAEAGLDLVPDEEQALLVADLPDKLVVQARVLDVAAVPLDRLHQDGRGPPADPA